MLKSPGNFPHCFHKHFVSIMRLRTTQLRTIWYHVHNRLSPSLLRQTPEAAFLKKDVFYLLMEALMSFR